MINIIKKKFYSFFSKFYTNDSSVSNILLSRILSKQNLSNTSLNSINDVEFKVFSQWGEDGIIDWLINILPFIPKTFIEFGVENYEESNTRLLLINNNWSGIVIDGSQENIQNIKNQEIYWKYDLKAINAFINIDNINNLISHSNFGSEIGILSIDIDGNDYWIWEKIYNIKPVIVICEYNAIFGDIHEITIPYDKNFHRNEYSKSNLYFGSSINALIKLAETKGYDFIGTNSNGCNAFFVEKKFSSFVLDKIKFKYVFPSKFREARDEKDNLLYINGIERVNLIKHLDIFNTDKKIIQKLENFENLYSKEWLENKERIHENSI
jgi:hypothetical protein